MVVAGAAAAAEMEVEVVGVGAAWPGPLTSQQVWMYPRRREGHHHRAPPRRTLWVLVAAEQGGQQLRNEGGLGLLGERAELRLPAGTVAVATVVVTGGGSDGW